MKVIPKTLLIPCVTQQCYHHLQFFILVEEILIDAEITSVAIGPDLKNKKLHNYVPVYLVP